MKCPSCGSIELFVWLRERCECQCQTCGHTWSENPSRVSASPLSRWLLCINVLSASRANIGSLE
jgi:hypothetical protein